MNIKTLIYFTALILFMNTTALAETEQTYDKSLREMFQNNEAIMYSINLRTFNADDKNGNGIIEPTMGETSGSFINAIERLDELKELGINTIHLLPITPTGKIKALGTAGSLYALSDFTKLNLQLSDVNSELSIKEQAKQFINECHKRGIKVIADLPSCGAYDLFINKPDLFVLDADGAPYVPADWLDVRLFNVPDNEKLLHSDIFMLHKIFINNMIDMGIDGIRADVATIKPYIFWYELIKYARSKKEDFMFLAEASESWKEPASDKAYFTDYKKLLEAGFDGYYGDYFELKNWKTMDELENAVVSKQKLLKKYTDKKSVIGSFETHDEVSPLIVGGENYAKIIIWLNATLPLNPYYVDGFLQADDYIYDYSNKRASETQTDDNYYYVHQGQIDIFNFSRKPGSDSTILSDEHKIAINLRKNYQDVITKGSFERLNSDNNKIFAYQRTYDKKSVVVIINRNLVNSEDINVKVKNINKKSKITFVKDKNDKTFVKSTFTAKMKPAEIVIFTIEQN
ncbi:MAG: alpha-glucosidase C-terminal domain-containing protein [Candidatus Gastranaerophilales bacterium]|nr:alpha-glucosidase C-terminal domain-containing protein [Candidatus Gastranaerophilales bacterium]